MARRKGITRRKGSRKPRTLKRRVKRHQGRKRTRVGGKRHGRRRMSRRLKGGVAGLKRGREENSREENSREENSREENSDNKDIKRTRRTYWDKIDKSRKQIFCICGPANKEDYDEIKDYITKNERAFVAVQGVLWEDKSLDGYNIKARGIGELQGTGHLKNIAENNPEQIVFLPAGGSGDKGKIMARQNSLNNINNTLSNRRSQDNIVKKQLAGFLINMFLTSGGASLGFDHGKYKGGAFWDGLIDPFKGNFKREEVPPAGASSSTITLITKQGSPIPNSTRFLENFTIGFNPSTLLPYSPDDFYTSGTFGNLSTDTQFQMYDPLTTYYAAEGDLGFVEFVKRDKDGNEVKKGATVTKVVPDNIKTTIQDAIENKIAALLANTPVNPEEKRTSLETAPDITIWTDLGKDLDDTLNALYAVRLLQLGMINKLTFKYCGGNEDWRVQEGMALCKLLKLLPDDEKRIFHDISKSTGAGKHGDASIYSNLSFKANNNTYRLFNGTSTFQ